MWTFLLGFLAGILFVVVVAYLVLFNVFGKKVPRPPFIDQFQPLRIPAELKAFLRSNSQENFAWESCLSISLLFHFLFQEHKDTRKFRRWVYKKLQLELNDVTTKYAASRIITGVQIRELSLGNESPVIKNIRVEKYQMSEDRELFDEISFEVDVDYRGGFETSVDLSMIWGRSAHLSIKVMKLAGKARIVMSRQPFEHWYFAFIEMPQLDFKIDSQFQGHQLKKIVPLITTAFRKAFQRKHVWPNYKLRYRPLLPHPFLQPAPPISSFDHINVNGTGLEVTVLQCTRLNTKLSHSDHTDVHCVITLDQRPFLTNSRVDSTHCISVMLTFTRKGASDSIGLSFAKVSADLKAVKVSDVEIDSTAEKCGFKKGDILLAINNVPIRNDKQALRLLSGTAGDLLVLVERDLSFYFEDEIDGGSGSNDAFSEEFICISDKRNENRRASNASLPSITDSFTQTFEVPRKDSYTSVDESKALNQSVDSSSMESPVVEFRDDKSQSAESGEERGRLLRARSTHIPKLSIQSPSAEITRSRSESDLLGDAASNISATVSNFCASVRDLASAVLDEEDEGTDDGDKTMLAGTTNRQLANDSKNTLANKGRKTSAANSSNNNGAINLDEDFQEDAMSMRNNLAADGEAKGSAAAENQLKESTDGGGRMDDLQRADSPKLSSKRERIQARASEMASKIHLGRAKFNDLIWSRAAHKTNKDELHSPTSSSARSSALLFAATLANGEAAECAIEADAQGAWASAHTADEAFRDHKGRVGSPSLELPVMDKSKKKWIKRIRKSPSPSTSNLVTQYPSNKPLSDSASSQHDQSNCSNGGGNSANNNVNVTTDGRQSPPPLIASRRTKSVALGKNPLWGQSLHFGLDQRTTKYLNVTIHSQKRFNLPAENPASDANAAKHTSDDSTLLGYASVYIPQIVEDCQLTLSNSHREVFHLRPPLAENGEVSSEFPELSRRTGFDARLCYGDITLGFRFFPQGLPDNTIRAPLLGEDSPHHHRHAASNNHRHEVVLEPADANNPLQQSATNVDEDGDEEIVMESPENSKQYPHKWHSIHFKHGFSYACGICHGKIWLKSASRCSVCNFICHNKCVDKANSQHECIPTPSSFDDNANFVVLDEKDLADPDTSSLALSPTSPPETSREHSATVSSVPTSTSSAAAALATTRRRRIATTVSEKLSTTWKNVGAVAAAGRRKTPSTASGAQSPSTSTAVSAERRASMGGGAMEDSASPTSPTVGRFVSGIFGGAGGSDPIYGDNGANRLAKITTIDKILDADFLASLSGSNNLKTLNFEPGNAYNPQIISATKATGQHVFDDISDIATRTARINEQIDIIQLEINRLSQIRRRLVSESGGGESAVAAAGVVGATATAGARRRRSSSSRSTSADTSGEVERLDIRREALALLMLHYCSGLSDCIEKEEEQIAAEKGDDTKATFDDSFGNCHGDDEKSPLNVSLSALLLDHSEEEEDEQGEYDDED